MKRSLPCYLRMLLAVACMLGSASAYATHIFGVDLYYTYDSGTTYTINMAIYGDCSAAPATLNSLLTATPEIQIFNFAVGPNPVQTINLTPVGPQGVEVTPVCASELNNTTCSNVSNVVPGVKKYFYSHTYNLGSASAYWQFHFDGNMGGANVAGRSATITNSTSAGQNVIALDAKLNNLTAPNSSCIFTTIPTPFFCINKSANFNPGAVDPNADSLSFALVPAVDETTGGPITYYPGYSATMPIQAAVGTFAFNSSNGQLSFTPNLQQRSLVVYTVSQYRNGIIVGTSQREMTFVVLSCNNFPPIGSISNINTTGIGVTEVDSTHLNACGSAGLFTFNINPTDSNTAANITMSAAGLPAGATFSITANNTHTPQGLFSWNTTGVAPGSYIFYLTFKDDACPLSSTQIIAYTVNVLPYPTNAFSMVSAATCTKKAVFHVTPGGVGSPYTIEVVQGGNVVHINTNITGVFTDSLAPGTYTIRVLSSNTCGKDTVVTIVPPIIITPAVTTNAPLCPGGSNGSLTIGLSGGVPPYTYALGAGAYAATNTFSNLTPGTYAIHIRDVNLCEKDTNVIVPDAPHTYFNAAIASPWCNFYSNGVISVSGYNTTAPYTYAIGSGVYGNSGTFSTLAAGTYAVHVKNTSGCVNDTSITLTDSLSVNVSLAVVNVACNGGASGEVSIIPGGGFGTPYTYAINGNPYISTNVFANLPVGTYRLQVRDVNQCFFDTSVTLTQPAPIVITPAITNITCFGNTDGMIVANTTGGNPGYTYTLNGSPRTGNSFSPLAVGTYIVAATDIHNCILRDTVKVTQPNPLAIASFSIHNTSCNGSSDGSFTINPAGGTASYSYAVDAGAFAASNVLGGLTAGTYAVHIKDANGCTKDTMMAVAQPTVVMPSVGSKNSTCHTLANGSVSVSASGGTPAYMYSIGNGAYSTSGVFPSLPGGVYTIHVKDANGCVQDVPATVFDSIIVTSSFVITTPLCYGNNNGSIVVTGAGGQAPYMYALAFGPYGSSDTFSNVGTGLYTIHIKEAHGCISDTNVVVEQPLPIFPHAIITPPSCYGFRDGKITVAPTGGTPGFLYALNGGGFSAIDSFFNLAAGQDTITVKDSNNCLQDTVVTILQPSPLMIIGLTLSDVKCFGAASGRVIVYVSGATKPYTYTADSSIFNASDTLLNLIEGNHLIEVMDSNGCLADSSIVLTQPTQLGFKVDSLIEPTCQGFLDGSVKLDGTGGTAPYTYKINSGAYSGPNAWYNLGEGTNTFYVQDNNNCIHDTTITLKGYPHIVIDNVTLNNITCYGAATGQIDVMATGGVQPLSYRLNTYGDLMTTSIFDSIKAGQYTVNITDSMQCKKDTTVTLTQPDSLHIAITATPNDCVGLDNMGAVSANVSGGTTPYAYLWNTAPAETSNSITGMPNGSYMVLVKDGHDCTDSAIAMVLYDDCCKPYIPNAFTPNNDGRDDIFRVVYKGDLRIENFSVYNRFGQRVYNTIYTGKGWDGTYNGVPQDMGTYFYYFKAICGNKGDHEIVLEGDVILIR